jgi:UDP-N-acetylglucosamine 1-carboxyvinyltransferase
VDRLDRIVVRARGPLAGRVAVAGATKNSGCKLMAAALLTEEPTTLANMTPVADLDVMIRVLDAIGVRVTHTGADELVVDPGGALRPSAPYELVSRMRASISVLGPLLARCGTASVALPGGDSIGSRKLDMHLRGLAAMGAELEISHGLVEARCERLVGTRVVLEFPSVGATENLLTAAVLAEGETTIENAAREPEITELATFLLSMGARIDGVGTPTLRIEGVGELRGVSHRIIGDRIETGTLLMACAIAGGEVTVEGARVEHLEMVVRKLGDMGLRITAVPEGLQVRVEGRLHAVDIATLPFPGFATDFMPPAVATLATAEGTAIVTENVFDNRLGFVDELRRMGADVRSEGRHAVVRGVARLSGAPVRALDVRAGAALVLAGLAADGETVVLDPYHLDRGYADLPRKLTALGADVERERA